MPLPISHAPGLRLVLMGAAPDTGNLGVSALGESVVHTIAELEPDATVTVFDNSRGAGASEMAGHPVYRQGLRHSRRVYETTSLWNAQLSMAIGGIFENPIVAAIREADAVLDLTGGDSFSDIYGQRVFRRSLSVKHLVLRCGTPLVLLPQTYGPYAEEENRQQAAEIVRQASMAWARDRDSFSVLQEMAGEESPTPLHCGVDVAVKLPAIDPGEQLQPKIRTWFDKRDQPVVGVNVSGLLLNRPAESRERYGLATDYRRAMRGLIDQLLRKTEARIVLVPHVLGDDGEAGECDVAACRTMLRIFGDDDRLALGPTRPTASQAKWVISHCDWFCGTRMHSTIAALSTGTPVAAIAYSTKTRGVFGTFGVAEHVADARNQSTDALLSTLWRSFESRADAAATLRDSAPRLRESARQQMRKILDHCKQTQSRESEAREFQAA